MLCATNVLFLGSATSCAVLTVTMVTLALCPQLDVVGGLTTLQSAVVSTQLAACVSGTDCMQSVARAVFSALHGSIGSIVAF